MSSTNQSNETLIRFHDVALGYGDFTVLKHINIEAKRGQVIAMMGGSGSGKTTLLRGATAQIFAQAGQIYVFDQDLGRCSPTEIEQLRKRMGDRKSTRLNSSHVAISYAVFCLKKKIDDQTAVDQAAASALDT